VLLQKTVDIGPDDTLGSLYFDHLFPMGVDAMCEGVDLVRDGKAPSVPQDDSKATYESWCRKADAEIDWAKPVDEVYNLIRGTNPQPGAWTLCNGNELKVFDSRKVEGSGTPGTVLAVEGDSIVVAAQGGAIRIDRVRPHDDKKISAGDFAAKAGLAAGSKLGS
jgi:methionyl-tRNA formyltransferase